MHPLAWAAGAGAAPDGYNVDLDGVVVTTTRTTSPTILSFGVHTWTVQVYNDAGASDWAPVRTVKVAAYRIYLPLVLRQ